jgi:hypothetical protein
MFRVCPAEDADAIDDYQAFHAASPQEAAEKWAQVTDSYGDYGIVRGCDAIVVVCALDGTVTRWIVQGETIPQYTARKA